MTQISTMQTTVLVITAILVVVCMVFATDWSELLDRKMETAFSRDTVLRKVGIVCALRITLFFCPALVITISGIVFFFKLR